jgi:5-formyltetrahydrofolate cyclo-ligase
MSEKELIRKKIWDLLEREEVARFPLPPHGRIPNFEGADSAAKILSESEIWKGAEVIKCNPDSPQRPVRECALAEGKTIYMAVPRLQDERCFIELHKSRIYGSPGKGATIKGAFKYGKQVGPKSMKSVDMVIAGSVVVNRKGARVGKGGGYSDLEFALGREFGIVGDGTPVISTVHELQIIEDDIPMIPHDVPLDFIVTSKGISSAPRMEKPKGILWDDLNEDKIASIPILMAIKEKKI